MIQLTLQPFSVYVGGLWVNSETTRALGFHFILGGCSFLFQTVTAKKFLLFDLRKIIPLTFLRRNVVNIYCIVVELWKFINKLILTNTS